MHKTRATLWTNEKEKETQPRLARIRFPALYTGDLYLLWSLIGSLRRLRLNNYFGFGFTTLKWTPLYCAMHSWDKCTRARKNCVRAWHAVPSIFLYLFRFCLSHCVVPTNEISTSTGWHTCMHVWCCWALASAYSISCAYLTLVQTCDKTINASILL